MKTFIFSILLLLCISVFSQDNQVHTIPKQTHVYLEPQLEPIGFFASSYTEVNGEKETTVKKPLYIIYNNRYCELFIGDISASFPVDASYTRELVKGDVVESFINDDAATVNRGWYSIIIEHNKAGSSKITINMPMVPKGQAYFVEEAQTYSRSGKVHVENWKEIEEKAKARDAKMAERKRINDSTLLAKRVNDSLSNVRYAEEKEKKRSDQLNEGNNENFEWENREKRAFEDNLRSRIKSKVDYGVDVRIVLKSDGSVDRITPVERSGAFYSGVEEVMPQILDYAKSIKFPPHLIDGKSYPYFVVVSAYGPATKGVSSTLKKLGIHF